MSCIRRLTTAVAAITAVIGLGSSATAAEPVLRQVLLSTGGVGYLGFDATPDVDGRVRLTVPLAQVDDILKSLTVLAGDGTVKSVSLLGPTPQGDLFRDVPFGP